MPEDTFPWKNIFIELALRALRRVHHDYLLWDVKQDWSSEPNLQDLNIGRGVEYAYEETVCAAITQEFIYSRYPSGFTFDGDSQPRHYRIAREQTYPDGKRVDIVVERIEPSTNEPVDRSVFIEAKRAFRWPTKLCGDVQSPTDQLDKVNADVAKLRAYRDGLADPPFTYVLVWNVEDEDLKTNSSPEDFFREVNPPILSLETRWAPISWSQDGRDSHDRTVKRWLWVCLAEV